LKTRNLGLIAALLFCAQQCFAALTVAQHAASSGSAATQTITLTSSVAAGQAIIIGIEAASNSVSYSSVTDSVNTGQYTHIAHAHDATNGNMLDEYFIVATSTGTPVITIVSTGFTTYNGYAISVNGFAGVPAWDSATYTSNGTTYAATTAATTLAITSLPVTSHNNEILVEIGNGGSGFISSFPGWTIPAGTLAYAIVATAGTDKSGTITWGSSAVSDALFTGIYDNISGVVVVPRMLLLNIG
jgi:hypothetical protein